MTIESLLVPFDGTEGARHALEQADNYARRVDLPIDLLVVGSPGLEDQDRTELQFESNRLRARVGEILVLTGDDVAATILRCLRDRPSAQLWMATHGRSRLGGLVLGSTAEAVLHDSRRPTTLVGPHVTGPTTGPTVVCVADLAPPEPLLAAAAWWSERLSCPLRVVTVTGADRSHHPPQALSHTVAENLERAGIAADVRDLPGEDPAETITRYVEREDVQLLVMATHARSGLRRALGGTVAMAVVHRAPCPALLQAADERPS